MKFELGLFENPYVDPDRADRISGAEATRPLALEAARQAIVLLRRAFRRTGGPPGPPW